MVPVADRPECAKALNTAFALGNRLGASVSGCHIRPHRYSEVSLATAFADADWRRKNLKKTPARARQLFEAVAESNGFEVSNRARVEPTAMWQEKVGSPEIIMGIVGPVNDLVVVSRPQKRKGVAEMFMISALLQSASPVLVLPTVAKKHIGHRVVIAWNQSSEAARTVRLSLSMLAEADEVTIVTAGAEDHPGPKSTQLANYLKQWGIKTTRESTRGRDVETEIMDVCRDRNADLLVAGAYSRSRWRERAFGGTTEYLLYEASIPLLTLHT
jgi:nucleotide-binding universal stress UspA family protein